MIYPDADRTKAFGHLHYEAFEVEKNTFKLPQKEFEKDNMNINRGFLKRES